MSAPEANGASVGNARWIEIEVAGSTTRFQLMERLAPKATNALWDTLPISGQLTHARWAGAACFMKVDRRPLAEITEIESQVTSLYQGTLALRPGSSGRAELFVSYGQAESRHERGRTYVTPLARVVGDPSALFEAMSATWKGGSAAVEIRAADGGSHE